MGDDQLSASELRFRYGKGGSVSDDQLSASQLRARHGVRHNGRDFSTKDNEQGGQGVPAFAIVLALLLAAVAAAYFSGVFAKK